MNNTAVAEYPVGRWDLIPSEVLDLFYEAGIPRDVSCDLLESLPEDLWPLIQITSQSLDPNSAKICNCITAILAYMMQHDFKMTEEIDVQLGSAFHYLQGKIAGQRIRGVGEDISLTRLRLDDLINRFFDSYYQGENYSAANESVH